MDKLIIIRFGELFLKGKNRSYFEKLLCKNIKEKIKNYSCDFKSGRSRYTVENYKPEDENALLNDLCHVFGIHSVSVAHRVNSDYENILNIAKDIVPNQGTFRVNVNRADKRYAMTSVQIAATLGGDLLNFKADLSVNLHNPQFIVYVDIREDKTAFIYSERKMGLGGMPVGCAGQGLLMLSGGIDSPVAGYMMSKRGLKCTALHFHSYPYTSERAKEKVIDLAQKLTVFNGNFRLICIPITKIQEEIHAKCDDSYLITLLRRFMMRIAEKVAVQENLKCIVNGESLGQVASQTLESITITNAMVLSMPVLRPLIGMDKQEIVDIAEKIDTYKLSILPYEDCCTIFLPENPVTKPSEKRAVYEEAKLGDYNALIEEAFNQQEIINIEY